MKASMYLLAFLGISHLVFGAQKINVQERVRRSLHDISGRRHPRSVEKDPDDLLGLDKDEHLKPQETMVTAQNTVKIKYSEEYKGLPVIGESVVLEQTSDGQFTHDASGSLLEHIANDVPSIDPALSAEDAFNIALLVVDRNPQHIMFNPDRDISLAIYTINAHHKTDDDQMTRVKAVLVYRVTIAVFDPTWPTDPDLPQAVEMQITIDANTGKVLHKSNLLESHAFKKQRCVERVMEIQSVGGNKKVGKYNYGKDWESLKVATEDGIICKVENEHVVVVHMNFSTEGTMPDVDLNQTEGYAFECKEGFNDTINGAYSPLSDTYFFFNKVVEMFQAWYKTKPLKNRAIMVVHLGQLIENAFYMSSQNLLVFGDGGSTFYPLTSVGVVAHEICHGYTSDHSNLEYSEQSGGINEAFSDMAGEAAQVYLTSKGDWMLGNEINKDPEGSMRWMDDPELDNSSISSLQHYCPGVNVHYSSGIFNKAFYLLANRPGWDVRKAFHVFLTANTLYWQKNTDFADGACGAVKAAKDLGFSAEDVKSVFLDVDVEPCVKRSYNFQNFINIYLSSKNRFQKYFDTGSIASDKVTLEVWLHEEDPENAELDEEPEYDLSVTFNGRKLVSLHSSKSESVDITDLQPGRYHIAIEGEVPKLSVYVIDNVFHGNISVNGSEGTLFLDLPDSHPDFGTIIRASGPRKIHSLSVTSEDAAYQGSGIEDNISQTLHCTSISGNYNVSIGVEEKNDTLTFNTEENDTFAINAYRLYNLFPRTNF